MNVGQSVWPPVCHDTKDGEYNIENILDYDSKLID